MLAPALRPNGRLVVAALVLALVAAHAGGARAAGAAFGGVHALDPSWERDVPVGALAPTALGDPLWLAPASVLVQDGLVRARFVVGERLDATLLVRAALDAQGELDRAIGVSIEMQPGRSAAHLRLLRYDRRQPRPLGADATLEGLTKGSVLELVVLLAGPLVDATVLDATLAPLARVAAHAGPLDEGRVGLRAARDMDAASRLTSLRVGEAGARDDDDERGARLAERPGPERLVLLRPEDEARVPADLRRRVLERGPDTAVLLLDPRALERVLREGVVPLSVSSDVPHKYVDASLRARLGKPPTPTPRGFRLDESYKDAAAVEALVRAYAARYPELTRLEEIGRSLEGRPILALQISKNPHDDEDEPAVLLDGAHHGGELMSTELALDAMQVLLERYGRDRAVTRIVDGMAVWIVPLVNPDGLHRFVHFSRDADRKNARDVDGDGVAAANEGVDLYRNYPVRHGGNGEVGSRSHPWHSRYRGEAGGTEPEVQALMALAARERFVASIDFHTNATKVLVPYTDPAMTNPEPNEAWRVAEELVAGLPVQSSGKRYTVARNLYAVDGTAQDWLRLTFGTVALLVEGPRHNPPFARGRDVDVRGSRPVWQRLCARVLEGPGVAGLVRDVDGLPLAAEIVIDEMAPRMGEVWTARPRDGRWHRLVPKAGAYTVRVRAPGHAEQVRRIVLDGKGTARLDVVLERAGAREGTSQ